MIRTIIISVLCILGINAYAQKQEVSLDPQDLRSVIEKNDKIIDFLKCQVKNKEDQIKKKGLNKPQNQFQQPQNQSQQPQNKPKKSQEKSQKKSFRDAVSDLTHLDSLYTAWPQIKNLVVENEKMFDAYETVYNMVQSLHSDFDKEENDKWLAVNVDDIKPNLLEKHRQQLEDLCLLIGDFEYIYEEEFKVVLDKVKKAYDRNTLKEIQDTDEYQDILRIPVLKEKIEEEIQNGTKGSSTIYKKK